MATDDATTAETVDEDTRDSDTAGGKKYDGKDMELIVRKRVEREQRKHKKEIEALRAEIDERIAQGIEDWREDHGIGDDVLEKLSNGGPDAEAKAELRSLRKENKTLKKQIAKGEEDLASMRELGSKYVVEHIKGVAADKGMHHPEDAVFRFERQCKYDWDSHEVVVIDSDKSVGDLFDAFLAERKDALKSTGTSGAGSRVGEVSVSTDSAPTDDLSKVWGPYQR